MVRWTPIYWAIFVRDPQCHSWLFGVQHGQFFPTRAYEMWSFSRPSSIYGTPVRQLLLPSLTPSFGTSLRTPLCRNLGQMPIFFSDHDKSLKEKKQIRCQKLLPSSTQTWHRLNNSLWLILEAKSTSILPESLRHVSWHRTGGRLIEIQGAANRDFSLLPAACEGAATHRCTWAPSSQWKVREKDWKGGSLWKNWFCGKCHTFSRVVRFLFHVLRCFSTRKMGVIEGVHELLASIWLSQEVCRLKWNSPQKPSTSIDMCLQECQWGIPRVTGSNLISEDVLILGKHFQLRLPKKEQKKMPEIAT